MSEEKKDKKKLPEDHPAARAERFAQRLMGMKKHVDPRKVDGPVYATFHDRLFASLLDGFIIFYLFNALFAWIASTIYQGVDQEALKGVLRPELKYAPTEQQVRAVIEHWFEIGFVDMWLLNSLVQSLFVGFILVGTWHFFHVTPGKWFVGVRIVDAKTLERPSLAQYIKRFAGFYVSLPVFMIGFVAVAFSKKKQAWHDKIAGTVVIYAKEGGIFRQSWDLIKYAVTRKKPYVNDNKKQDD